MGMKAETALVLAKKEIDKKISEAEINPIGLDSTLTDEKKAATASVVGEKITELKGDIVNNKYLLKKISLDGNLFDIHLMDNKYYIEGVESTWSGVYGSEFIDIQGNRRIATNLYSFVEYWDENKNYISENANVSTHYENIAIYDIPTNCKYVSFSYDSNMQEDRSRLLFFLTNDDNNKIMNYISEHQYIIPVVFYDDNLIIPKYEKMLSNEKYLEYRNKIDCISIPNSIRVCDSLKCFKDSISNTHIDIINMKYNLGTPSYLSVTDNIENIDFKDIPDGSNALITVNINGISKFGKYVSIKNKNISTVSAKKIMLIGDSITNRGLANSIDNAIYIKYGVNFSFIGTMTNEYNKKGEGREGWKYTNFIGKDLYSINGTYISPQTEKSDGSLDKNPFLRLANSNDDTSKVFTIGTQEYTFDFGNYLSVQELESPDVVIISLSTNDILSGNNNFISDCLLSLKIMYESIRSSLPNAYIGVVPTYGFAMTPDGNVYEEKALTFTNECIEYIETVNDDKLELIPLYMFINRLDSFPYELGDNASNSNNMKNMTITDSVHNWSASNSGYVLAQWIVNITN